MMKRELLAALADLPDDAEVMVSIKEWDEPLNLTGVRAVAIYGKSFDKPDEVFAALTLDVTGATRLDPNGA